MPIFTFNNAVLFRSVRACELMKNAISSEKVMETIVSKFTTIIRSKNFNFRGEKIFDLRLKDNKLIKHIRFETYWIKPGEPSEVINKQDIILET